jgi:hypothetical protein
MSRTIIINAIGFIGSQAAIILSGAVVGMVLGWTPAFAAEVTVQAQMLAAGFCIRGWI